MVNQTQPNPDFYATVGAVVHLLEQSAYHRQHAVGDYLNQEIIPAIHTEQYRLFLSPDSAPVAFLSWAWISKNVETEIHETGRGLQFDEWQSGDLLFLNDFFSPHGNPLKIVKHEFVHGVFKDTTYATGIRRNLDGSVRRITRWTGGNFRFDKVEVKEAA